MADTKPAVRKLNAYDVKCPEIGCDGMPGYLCTYIRSARNDPVRGARVQKPHDQPHQERTWAAIGAQWVLDELGIILARQLDEDSG